MLSSAVMSYNLDKDLQTVKNNARKCFGRIPGVLGFGIGDNSIRLYVHDADVHVKFPEKEFPKDFEGVKMEVIITGEILANL